MNTTTTRHVNAISGRLSLRRPQRRALEILDHITELLPSRKDNDLQAALAVILEREAQQWFKPARGQFLIHYNGAWSTTSTSPISWRKRKRSSTSWSPKPPTRWRRMKWKARVAVTWCQRAGKHAEGIGGKPWRYLLIPHDAIAENMTLDHFASRFQR
ncbi:MAG: hypothetical protein HQL81_08170 [Magnetococcales bacterium]|nr:hypothetical protein [Magnetococcales bacterium]